MGVVSEFSLTSPEDQPLFVLQEAVFHVYLLETTRNVYCGTKYNGTKVQSGINNAELCDEHVLSREMQNDKDIYAREES